MAFLIRHATSHDAAGIAQVINPIIAAGCFTIMTEPLTEASQLEWMADLCDRSVIYVAVHHAFDRLVGVQSIEPMSRASPATAHVGDISTFVALECRGHGIGRALTHATIADARAKEYRKLLAIIRADNADAIAFYSAQGFGVRGVLREHVKLSERFADQVVAERHLV